MGLIQPHPGYGNVPGLQRRKAQLLQCGHTAPVWRHGAHEQLVEGVKAAGNARRQANQEDKQFLIAAELTNVRQQIIKVHGFL